MTTRSQCERLAGWTSRYPDPEADPARNAAARADEDAFLARFAGLDTLTRSQARRLVQWKFGSMPHRRVRALRGIDADAWAGRTGPSARDAVRGALAATDDREALDLLANPTSGVYGFGPAMGSAILAACRPQRFTVADARALAALRRLRMMPAGPASFRLRDWVPYLAACRALAAACSMSLRDVDRALWVAGGRSAATPRRRPQGSRR